MLARVIGVVAIVAVLCVVALVISSHDETTISVDGETEFLETSLDCSSYIDMVPDLPEEFSVVQGVAAINSTIVHQQGRRGTDDDPESPLRFSKIALLVRPNKQFQVHVGNGSPETTRIGWSSVTSGSPVKQLSIGPCASNSDQWFAFAGGVWVIEPSCVELVFQTSKGTASVWLSIGKRCDQS